MCQSISSLKLSHLTLIYLCYLWKQSDVAGEVLKLLSDDGGKNKIKKHSVYSKSSHFLRNNSINFSWFMCKTDSIGYGEPLVAVLPSFHDINIQ